MDRIDVERLIVEIEKRPALWDMRRPEYSDRIIRRQCWDEITIIFGSDDMTATQRNELGILLHKKWKNVRDNFSRDIQRRKGKSGDKASGKAPYIYSQQLQFLRDTVEPKQTTSSLQESLEHQLETTEDQASSPIPITPINSKIGRKRLHPLEEKIIASLDRLDKRSKTQAAEDDDNRHFLLSLLPTLSSLPKRMNSKCRLELMQVINKYEEQAFQLENQLRPISFPAPYLPAKPTTSNLPNLPSHSQHEIHQAYQQQQKSQQHTVSQEPEKLHHISQQFQQIRYNNPYQPEEVLSAATSPLESVASYISSFSEDSGF